MNLGPAAKIKTMGGNNVIEHPATLSETFGWCGSCWLADTEKTVTNNGGGCCTAKHKRAFGKLCDYWIRKKEGNE